MPKHFDNDGIPILVHKKGCEDEGVDPPVSVLSKGKKFILGKVCLRCKRWAQLSGEFENRGQAVLAQANSMKFDQPNDNKKYHHF